MKYARVIDSVVQEVFTPPAGFTLQECFHPDLVIQFEPCPEEVEGGWLKQEDGTFIAPPTPPEPIDNGTN